MLLKILLCISYLLITLCILFIFSEYLGDLPAPELKHGSKGYSFLTLHWSGPINNNVTYYIQSRVLDTNGDWSIYGGSLEHPNGDLKITDLQPFMNYTVRMS